MNSTLVLFTHSLKVILAFSFFHRTEGTNITARYRVIQITILFKYTNKIECYLISYPLLDIMKHKHYVIL
jgi:hypothetical protein